MHLAHRYPRPTGAAPRPARLSRRGRDESGETLIEVMASVVLMGTAIVAILAGLFTAVVTSDLHKRQTRAANEVTNAIEAIQRATYLPCGGPTAPDYSSALPAMPAGYTASITSTQYLQSSTAADPTWGACPGTDQGEQKITVSVSQGTGGRAVKETIVYVKRNTRCSATVATGC